MNNQDPEFVEERLHGLQRFINSIIKNIYLRNDNLLIDFLSLPDTAFNLLRSNNAIQNYYDFSALKDAVVSDAKNLAAFKTVK